MHDDLKKLIANERKYKRELVELRQLRLKQTQYKNPDQKVINMIDVEIAKLTGDKTT